MPNTLTGYDPARHGLREAPPIRRKRRSPSSRRDPKPQYADAVWHSFNTGKPLETTVRVTQAEDTVRALKRAARYLERHNDVEVRVQISVEEDVENPKKSLVKFLGHEPWLLGRRISKEANASETPRPDAGRHRTVAARKSA